MPDPLLTSVSAICPLRLNDDGVGRSAPARLLLNHTPRLASHRAPPCTATLSNVHADGKSHVQLGQKQASQLRHNQSAFYSLLSPSTTLLCSSPLRRTLQTTLLAFAPFLPPTSAVDPSLPVYPPSDSVPLMLLPQLQEVGWEPCDLGQPLELTRSQIPFDAPWLDWSLVESEPDWNRNKGFYEATEWKQLERARWVRRWLRARSEEVVVVVCHAGFLRRMTGAPPKSAWMNAEIREFRFRGEAEGEDEDEEAELIRVDGIEHVPVE